MIDPLDFFVGVALGVILTSLVAYGVGDTKVRDCAEKHNVYTCEYVLKPKLQNH